jgi:hypothetical protein
LIFLEGDLMQTLTLAPLAAAFATLSVAGIADASQCTASVVTAGLRAPTKALFTTQRNLLVAEQGAGVNTGRVSIVDPATGDRRTLIDGLPSAHAAPNDDPSGPSGLAMRGRTLYVTIGLGDAVVTGPAPNSFLPNPDPSSPLFSSVLAIQLSARTEAVTAGFELTADDQVALKNGGIVTLDNGAGDRVTVELVADFPDYVSEPRPDLPEAVRQSNPFGAAIAGGHLFVADASSNIVRDIDLDTREVSTLTEFAPLPNNRGFGPPVVEAVPDSVRVMGSQLLVSLLSGFPFPIGNSQVRVVDIATGASAPFITGLSAAIDVLPDDGGFLTLEFSTDMLAQDALGRLSARATPSSPPVVIDDCLVTPTSVTRDPKSRALFITEIFTGRVMKVPR